MRIVVVSGSPKPNGNTLKVVKCVEKSMKSYHDDMEFDYIELAKENLQMCKGCYRCLSEGEEHCPIQDDKDKIAEKMDLADAFIFATPVYVANVSGSFKNFLDRFAYICHRPRFHGKKAMVVCTTGSVASGIVNVITRISVETWGCHVVAKVGAIVSPGISNEDMMKQENRNLIKVEKASKKFIKELLKKKREKASLKDLMTFQLQKMSFRYADPSKSDYKYWDNKGWLNKSTHFYMDARVNPFLRFLANRIAEVVFRQYPRGDFDNSEYLKV